MGRAGPAGGAVSRAAGRVVEVQVARWRRAGWADAAWAVRLTASAVASYAVALGVFSDPRPLLAPLTALLVVQVTPVSLLASGLDRVVSVVAGVGVAVALASFVQLTWWSLGIAIALSLLIGSVLGLGANRAEVPISAMLVLSVGSFGAQAAAGQRIGQTLVGAAVGVVSTLLVPPRITTGDAGEALQGLAERVAALLDGAADELVTLEPGDRGVVERASSWLGEVRRLSHDVPNVGTALLRAEESRRLNLRALGTPDTGPGLRQGMEALEHSVITVRSTFRSLHDTVRARTWDDDDLGRDVRDATALALHEQAAGVRAFGRLVRAEAGPAQAPPETAQLRQALDGLLEARARLTDLVLVHDPAFAELTTAMLTTVGRLLSELSLEERLARLERARHDAQRRAVPGPLARRRLPPDRRPRDRHPPDSGAEDSGAQDSGAQDRGAQDRGAQDREGPTPSVRE